MFTGIIEETGEIDSVDETDDGVRIRIRGDEVLGDVEEGASISVSGVCLTVEEYADSWFEVFLAQETVEKTYLGDLSEGDVVNLERALRADDRLDGHFVQGHVDTTTQLTDVRRVGDDWEYDFALPDDYSDYIVSKGSVSLDGISLTVAEVEEETFTVAVIPTTHDLTNLSEKEVGDSVNIEVDVIAKYVESLVSDFGQT
ncbi:riboflavin synthase [Halorutilales archaeon Cl-col2-1]